jgi:GxxExxY protein
MSLAKAQRRKGKDGTLKMDENEISRIVVDSALKVHRVLGPGLLESAYVLALKYELERRGLKVERERSITITYGDLEFTDAFRADLIVEGKVILELKSVEALADVHKKQLLTYLKLTGLQLGLLINFGAGRLKDGIVRIVNGLPDHRPICP